MSGHRAPRGLDGLISFRGRRGLRRRGSAGLVSLGLLRFTGSNCFVTVESVFDLAYHVPERHPVTQRVVSATALFGLTGLVLLATAAAAVGAALARRARPPLPAQGGGRCRRGDHRLGGGPVGDVRLAGLEAAQDADQPAPVPARGAPRGARFLAGLRRFPRDVTRFGRGFSRSTAFGSVLLFVV